MLTQYLLWQSPTQEVYFKLQNFIYYLLFIIFRVGELIKHHCEAICFGTRHIKNVNKKLERGIILEVGLLGIDLFELRFRELLVNRIL